MHAASLRSALCLSTKCVRQRCRDLLKLRLKTAEAYVKVLTGGAGGGENGAARANHQLSVSAAVVGLGPRFRLQLKVCGLGACAH